jgi:hypothetical protein
MGYDTHIAVVRILEPTPEYVEDKDKPYSDGSGYHYKKDEYGNIIRTGRTEITGLVICEMDLCKLGSSRLSAVQGEALKKAKDHLEVQFYSRYATDGNTKILEDAYGDPLCVAEFDEVLKALRLDCAESEYRRIHWALALLESMKGNQELEIGIMMWGS